MTTSDDEPLSATIGRIPTEREHFSTLLMMNPNYFGNLAKSAFQPVKPIALNTTYEQLACVGLNPAHDRLEAIVRIKREAGYGGSICGVGSQEYVRFFVDLHDNGVWHDVGVANVGVHDIPGKKPLCYGVHVNFAPFRKLCQFENIVNVRAILQWNAAPPSDPSCHPVWGNVVDVQVQIRPSVRYRLSDLLGDIELAEIELPDPIGPIVATLDPTTELPVAPAVALSLHDRRRLYDHLEIPTKRYAFPDVHQFMAASVPGALVSPNAGALSGLGLAQAEIESIVAAILTPEGNTSYEQLSCIGLEPEAGLLEGVVTIKRPYGYGGPLCSKGTLEYVAFWIDFGMGLEYMGTTSVNVHDLKTIPKEDLQYAVYLKKDLSAHQIDCEQGAKVVRMRAILSWEQPPPPTNPDFVPTWGNRQECLVALVPGTTTGHYPVFESVSGVPLPGSVDVDGVTVGGKRPFGGIVTLAGRIGNPPNSYPTGASPLRYRIELSGPAPDTTPQSLNHPMPVRISESVAGMDVACEPNVFECTQVLTPIDDGDGLGAVWYEYLEDTSGNEHRTLVTSTLATWNTLGLKEGLWTVRIIAKDPVTLAQYTSPDDAVVHVRIDNTAPSGPAGPNAGPVEIEAAPPLEIKHQTLDGVTTDATDCQQFTVGTTIDGVFEVHDPAGTLFGDASIDATEQLKNQHFERLELSVFPDLPGNVATIDMAPSAPVYPIVATDGVSGTWSLDTSQMRACGYVLWLTAPDRSIVSGTTSNVLYYKIGFSLVEP